MTGMKGKLMMMVFFCAFRLEELVPVGLYHQPSVSCISCTR